MDNTILNILSRAIGSTYTKLKKTDEYMFWSPFITHHKPKLQINIKSQKWHCWVSNQGGHNFYQLFKAVGVSQSDWSDLKEYLNEQDDYYVVKTSKNQKIKVSLPKEFKRLNYDTFNTPLEKRCINFLKERGFDNNDIIRYGVGYCESGEYSDRIIIPSYDKNGRLNYFIARDLYDRGMKYKNPPVSKNIICFEMYINWEEPIILCEGVFDAMTIKRNAIPLFGKTISKSLITKIIKKHVKKVYIVLDDDAIKDSIKMIERLLTYGIQTYFVKLKGKDPNEIGFNNIWNIIHETNPLNLKELVTLKLSQGRI